jgi:hypothetical protein
VNDLGKIISQLEHQRTAIERAISALREIDGSSQSGAVTPATVEGKTTAQKRHISPEGRKRIIEATKRRWAAKRAADRSGTSVQTKSTAPPKSRPAGSGAAAPATAGGMTMPRKGHISPEGRKKLAEAMKRRWAAKRAAGASTTAVSSKKAAPAKKGAR